MKHPSEWSVWTLLAAGFVCGIAFVSFKIGQKHNLTSLSPKEWTVMIVGGGALGAFLFYALRLTVLANRK